MFGANGLQDFDYVIVGAGSAGSVIAARLSESGQHSVLVLEAGGAARHPWIRIPIGYGKTFYDTRFNWAYTADPDPGIMDRAMYWPRGKGLGGSSAINAMVWVRGAPSDYAEWGQVALGWDWPDVEPVFRRIERWTGAAHPARGVSGPLTVTDVSEHMHPLSRAYVQAAQEAGFAFNPDYNAERFDGVGYYQITTRNGMRASAAGAYLRPAMRRGNLRVETGAHVTRVLFEGGRATGVTYRQNGQMHQVRARSEVVLCGGALNSPQLLMLSGIGDGAHLQEMGIDVVHPLAQVGRNLSDHLGIDHLYTATRPSLNQELRPVWGKLKAALRYGLFRTGPLSMSLNHGGGFVQVHEGDGAPDLQLYFSPLSYSKAPSGTRPLMSPDPFPAFRLGFSPCKPTSRGVVSLRTPDPFDPPRMQPNYLSTEDDCAMMVAGSRLVRRIAEAPSLRAVTVAEKEPGSACESDAQLLDHARRACGTVFHQCGTCAMGRDPARSVVDARLRVHGVAGLRVADASVFPTIPSGNTNAPAMMVGEKAADVLLEDAKHGGAS
ncbi:GMC family oxidoreductase N-terminal domain-containing protein [Marivita sp. S6314]|uniref:GMC family oxidoreductase n=1 Tax=Marivita sp. S6314 TaxID=2926406 RepID=UPI001FF6F733|nr:GMC family oxidoreductase N-terminal domain-containing protein [Marivita sp. S6314]MCK0151118.1 GMC family oxidoreductase N-terminal domain-containing protein [Marivita sp. S6314]